VKVIQVNVEAYMSDATASGIAATFRSYGFEVDVDNSIAYFIGPETHVEIPAATVITLAASAFITTLAVEFGKDAYKKLKELVAAIHRDRPIKKGRVEIGEWDSHNFAVILRTDLPDDAYRHLFELDLRDYLDGSLSWDDNKGAVSRSHPRSSPTSRVVSTSRTLSPVFRSASPCFLLNTAPM
jgi:hypothetical protein